MKKIKTLIIISLATFSIVIAQKKYFYNDKFEKCKEKEASYYLLADKDKDCDCYKGAVYYITGEKYGEGEGYTNTDPLTVKDGKYTAYYKNGNKREEFTYKNMAYDGIAIQYFENGKINKEYTFVNGKANGILKEYFEKGSLSFEGNYNDSQKNGLCKWYYENGIIRFESFFKNDIKNGNRKEYNEKGSIVFDGNFSNDKKDGLCKWYYDSGKLKNEYTFKNDMWNGYIIDYNEDGTIAKKGYYENGKHMGRFPNDPLVEKEVLDETFSLNYRDGGQNQVSCSTSENHKFSYKFNGTNIITSGSGTTGHVYFLSNKSSSTYDKKKYSIGATIPLKEILDEGFTTLKFKLIYQVNFYCYCQCYANGKAPETFFAFYPDNVNKKGSNRFYFENEYFAKLTAKPYEITIPEEVFNLAAEEKRKKDEAIAFEKQQKAEEAQRKQIADQKAAIEEGNRRLQASKSWDEGTKLCLSGTSYWIFPFTVQAFVEKWNQTKTKFQVRIVECGTGNDYVVIDNVKTYKNSIIWIDPKQYNWNECR